MYWILHTSLTLSPLLLGIPPDVLSQRIEPGAAVGGIGLLLAAFRGLGSDLKEALKAREPRQEKQMGERKKAKEGLAEKVDPLPAAVSAAKA